MIDFKSDVISNNERINSGNFDGNVSLTWLWEVIVRTKRLPDNLDPKVFFVVLRERLKNPEREVRLHALRVLADLIPVLETKDLDQQMSILMSELITNLTYVAPAVRKGTVDVLRIYLKNTSQPNEILKNILTTISDDNYLKLGIIMAVPNLITHQISEDTLSFILQQLFDTANHQFLQEAALNSLVKIHRNLGHEKFEKLAGPKLFAKFQQLCNDNNVVLEDSNVILETEITLDTGPAITMKIHEEDTFNNDEMANRSPRKVHFGGEVVKMRTPESDSNQGSDNERKIMVIDRPTSIKITVAESVGMKTRHKSFIPVRIKTSSVPSTPKKVKVKRLNNSAPDLGRIYQSKIPLRTNKVKTPPGSRVDEFSPIPIHNEIEVFHNLTRSPTREQPESLETTNDSLNLPKEAKISNEQKDNNTKNVKENSNFNTDMKPDSKPIIDTGVFYKPKNKRSAEQTDQKPKKVLNIPKSIIKNKSKNVSPQSSPSECFGDPIKNGIVKLKNPESEEPEKKYLPVLVQETKPSSSKHRTSHISRKDLEKSTILIEENNNFTPFTKNNEYKSFMIFKNDQEENNEMFQSFKICNKEISETQIDAILHGLIHEGDIWRRSRLLDQLASMLPVHSRSYEIFDTLLNMEQHPRLTQKIHGILNLCIDYYNDGIFPEKLILKLIKMDNGVNLALKLFAQKYSPNLFFQQLPNVDLNENTLKILIGIIRMLPKSEVDVLKGIEYATKGLRDERRKIRQAALEALATLAQLSNKSTILDAVTKLNSEQILKIVRNRLSRRQLPSIDVNGNIRYSSPKDQEEFDWLCGSWCNEPKSHDEIWTLDEGTLPKIDRVYVVPNEKTYKRYDRGRSNSPPKDTNSRNEFIKSQQFRKSFSSEQIYRSNNKIEPTSYSLSSRSSTTSTGSSKSGFWSKSNIPVPVFDKLKIKHRPEGYNGPLIAIQRKSSVVPLSNHQSNRESTKLDSSQVTPIITRLSPNRPPASSGSESSGYFTPPTENLLKDQTPEQFSPIEERYNTPKNHRRFIEKENDDHLGRFIPESERFRQDSFQEEDDYPTVDRFVGETYQQNEGRFVQQDSFQESEPRSPPPNNYVENNKENNLMRELSVSSISETGDKLERSESHSDHSFDVVENRIYASPRLLSKSEANLKTTFPEIPRKNVNSAPPLNDLIQIVPYMEQPVSPKTALPGCCNQESPKIMEHTPKRLLKRTISQKTPTRKIEKPLKPNRTKDNLHLALQQMENCDWETVMLGLNNLSKICRHNPEALEPDIHTVCVTLAKNIKNLRSQVSRNACKVAEDMFAYCKKFLEVELEELAGPLLHRTADTNKFLRSDANAALDSMAQHLPISRVVAVIANKGSTHQNGVVRAASTRILGDIANRLGTEKIYQLPKETRDKFFLISANGLTEGNLESRKYSKALLTTLAGHPNFHRFLMEVVPPQTMRHISKIVNSLKK